MKKKNIFLLVLDGFRADKMSCNGHKRNTTPFIDSLAAKGISFSNAYTVSHSSLPAHISLFTGVHPYFHKVATNCSYFNNQFPYLTGILKDNGYGTVGVSTLNQYLSAECGFIRYFDRYLKIAKTNRLRNVKIKNMVKKQAVDIYKKNQLIESLKDLYRKNMRYHNFRRMARFYLDNDMGGKRILQTVKEQFDISSRSGNPFFIFANIIESHSPFLPPKGFRNYFGERKLTNAILDAFFDTQLFDAGRVSFSPEEQESLEILYDNGMRYADSLVEDLFAHLDKKGYLDDTIVIIMSDHGEMLNESGHFIGHGASTYEGLMRIPIIIFDKTEGGKAGVRKDLVSLIDVFPTIVKMAGGELDRKRFNYKGVDLLDNSQKERFVICEMSDVPFPELLYRYPEILAAYNHIERVIVDKNIKFVWRSDGKHAIYDLTVDKTDKVNLFERYKNTLGRELTEKMVRWYREQAGPEEFFSLECFDQVMLKCAGSARPEDLVITQDEDKVELIADTRLK